SRDTSTICGPPASRSSGVKGDLGACAMAVIGALPWGKIFKAKKIGEAIFRAGKAVITWFKELDWARAILKNAEKAAEAAKAAAAAAAREAAQKAAAAKAAAEAAAKKAAAEAAERAKALAAKAKAATKKAAGDAGSAAGGTCPVGNSFVAGTAVLLADGSSKPIEAVQPGDTVLATDPVSGRSEARSVTHTIRTDSDKEYVDVTVSTSGGGRDTITATDHHPFWSATQRRWVDAADLRPGELLRTSAGTYVQVGAVRAYHGKQVTYNLSVDDLQTYYVLAGDTPVLVHNRSTRVTKIGCDPTSILDDSRGIYILHLKNDKIYVGITDKQTFKTRVPKHWTRSKKGALKREGYSKDDIIGVTLYKTDASGRTLELMECRLIARLGGPGGRLLNRVKGTNCP
ncbi:polymorphic toxin-type HINT domain-containing protein, partial [Asanoa sp. NPDC050611]|uniref:polymorphic toxin-type HINT domain-containing protein n=1 Tax=Asanoa sp. NPDC050611 TaxID=3157098 RepID=UPI0033D802B7